MNDTHLDDLLDRLVGEFSDRLAGGTAPRREEFLARAPAEARPGLERCLKMMEAGVAHSPAQATLLPGARLGRYELLREIGRGGMSVVWLAKDVELHRAVALKVLRPGLALEEKHVDRFRREALAIAKLKHPHIVQVFEVGSERGWHFLAMEYVDGPSLATVLDALPRPRRFQSAELAKATGIAALSREGDSLEVALARLLAPIAGALAAAHSRGLVHRDVKPSNVLIHRDGRAVIADFGLAKGEGDPALSLSGDPIGTPFYMSPEQAFLSDAKVDHRTDVYSLGVTLYEALAGRRPYQGATLHEVFEAIRTQVPPGLRSLEPRCSRSAAALVRRCIARHADDRYGSATELEQDLVALAEGRMTHALQEEGSAIARFWRQLRFYASGQPYEFKSGSTFLGLPLVHVYGGMRHAGQGRRVAKGWFAASPEVAIGAIAAGGVACGGITCAGVSLGLLGGWGGIATGLFAFGGLAAGGFVFAGVGLGYLAVAGVALGYGAIGGYARGVYALGGEADGAHVIRQGSPPDPEAEAWFREVAPWALRWLGAAEDGR